MPAVEEGEVSVGEVEDERWGAGAGTGAGAEVIKVTIRQWSLMLVECLKRNTSVLLISKALQNANPSHRSAHKSGHGGIVV